MRLNKKILPRGLYHVTLLKLFNAVGKFYAIWPLKSDATTLSVLYYEIMWSVSLLKAIGMILGSFFSIYCCYVDLKELMKSITEITYNCESLFILIYFRRRKLRLKNLFAYMESFDRISKPWNQVLNASLLTRIQLACSIMPVTFIIGAMFFIFSPFLGQRAIPLNVVSYSLPVGRSWCWFIVYLVNVLAIIQVSVVVFVDLMVVALIWYATYRFKLVKISLQSNVKNGLSESTVLHQRTINYAKEIDKILAPIIVEILIAVSIYMTTCSLLVLNNVPLFELSQFFLITFFSGLRLFLCCWSADALTEAAYDIAWNVYKTPWFNRPLKDRQNIVIMLQRCQKPIAIRASAIVPDLSLRFYASVLYKTFSFFMTLRTILHV